MILIATIQERFLIDPVTGVVGRIDHTSCYVTIVEPNEKKGELWNIDAFVRENTDSVCVSCKDSGTIPRTSEELRDRAFALDFCTLLFDPEVRVETKKRIASELEALFEDQASLSHVKDVMYAAPMPQSADLSIVGNHWLGEQVGLLLKELVDSQARIRDLFSIWEGMKSEPLVEATGHRALTGRLIGRSFFYTLVHSGATQADVDQIGGNLAIQLQDVCNPRVLSKVISEYKKNLAPGIRRQRISESSLDQSSGETEHRLIKPRRAKTSNHQLFVQAGKEVSAIASLYAEGKDSQADEFLSELLVRQSESSPEFVVKSLCNIASRTSISGRRDVSFQLLQQALEQPEGLDAVLYLQIGNELRSIFEFDKAIECYQRAKQLDDGSKAAGIRDEIIRTLVAKGDYSLALSQYEAIPEHEKLPSTLTSLGSLHRKMGNLRSAREVYQCALDASEGFNHVAYAGLAEAIKQSGDPYRAIAKYNSIFASYSDTLDSSSKRIYGLALSQLYRRTEQYSAATQQLRRILASAPLDQETNLQLAKISVLTGDVENAKRCMELARVPDLSGVALELFRFAMARISEDLAFQCDSRYGTTKPIEAFLPEDRGLVSCRNAIDSIQEGRFNEAIGELQSANFVDKTHREFATVLRFHAHIAQDASYDYREDQAVCRILKRGLKPLRRAAQFVRSSDLASAIHEELRLCIIVA